VGSRPVEPTSQPQCNCAFNWRGLRCEAKVGTLIYPLSKNVNNYRCCNMEIVSDVGFFFFFEESASHVSVCNIFTLKITRINRVPKNMDISVFHSSEYMVCISTKNPIKSHLP
jgi:hypothetical protein